MNQRNADKLSLIAVADPVEQDRLTDRWTSGPAREATYRNVWRAIDAAPSREREGAPVAPSVPLHRHAWVRAAALATVVVGIAATISFWPGSTPSAWAGWTPAVQPSTPADHLAIREACRVELARSVGDPGQPVASDIRGNGGLVVFDRGASCSALRPGGAVDFEVHSVAGGSTDVYRDAMDHLDGRASLVSVLAAKSDDPASSYVWGVASEDIAAVTVSTSLGPVEATLDGPVWLAWWPNENALDVSVKGTGADGRLLIDGTFSGLQVGDTSTPGQEECRSNGPQCPELWVAEIVANAGPGLVTEILSDGYVDDAEYADWFDEIRSCMRAKQFDISISPDGDGYAITVPGDARPGPLQSALRECEQPGDGIIELRLLQDHYPEHWDEGE